MADTLVSILLEKLVSITLQDAEQELRMVAGVKEEVDKLNSNLCAINGVLEDAERRQMREVGVKQWLDKLRDVSYDMDDVLDKWNTAILKKHTEGDRNTLRPKKEVCSFIPSCFHCRQVSLRRDVAIQIKALNKRLDDLSNEKRNFEFTLTSGNEKIERQNTASIIDVSEVRGRDQEKNQIVDMLFSESSQESTFLIISIVGMGGVGKTTLAQLIYNDDTVKAHFQKRIWVCVSDPFDEISIAKTILEALTDCTSNLNKLDPLLQHISHSVEGKRFLLVLDDVWTEDYRKLEQLKNSLKSGSPGSRILVTTRKETVAKVIGTTDIVRLGQLSKKECWSLFSHLAFLGRSNEECNELEDIGRGIADKCKGLPLAAKVLGNLLQFKNTREEWQSVLNSEVWKLEEAERGLFPPLLLSYYDLSSTMRRCFSYCAIFPKDYKMEKNRLIKLWMAQGYFRATHSIDMEMVGEECFRNLAMRSFFHDVEVDLYGIVTFKMHDIVHDFAQFLTKNECFVMDVSDPEELRLDFSHETARHSMLMLPGIVSISPIILNVKKLRSLIVEYKDLPLTSAAQPEVFEELKCLRTLDLSADWRYGYLLKELPKEIGKLIHLRYLNLAYNDQLKELPETVCDLSNLQSLNISACHTLEKLPHGLGKLMDLRHLEICLTSLTFMPKGIERLTSLRTLDTFYVSCGVNNSEASNLGYLENLKYLRGELWLKGLGKVRDVEEVKKAQFEKKEHLILLFLDFRGEEAKGRMINDEKVVEAIQPPPNLESLLILGYRGTTLFPNWMMSLTNLKMVQICECQNFEFLPPLGKLSFLETLTIGFVRTKSFQTFGGMKGVKRVGIEFLGIETDESPSKKDEAETSSSSVIAFPRLNNLYFVCMDNWEEWDYGVTRRMEEEEEDISTTSKMIIMPRLSYLEIVDCRKFKALPDHILHTTSLKELKISYCPILEERYYKEKKGEDWPKISHIPDILINLEYVQKDGR